MLRRAVPTGAAGPIGEDTSRWGARNWANHDERRKMALSKVVDGTYSNLAAQPEGQLRELHRLVMANGSYSNAAKGKLLGEMVGRILPLALLPPGSSEPMELRA